MVDIYKSGGCTGSVTQAGRHTETRKIVDIYKSESVACARATCTLHTVCDPVRQVGTRKRVDIYKTVSVASAHATRTRQTVCDPGRQGHGKGLTFIRL